MGKRKEGKKDYYAIDCAREIIIMGNLCGDVMVK